MSAVSSSSRQSTNWVTKPISCMKSAGFPGRPGAGFTGTDRFHFTAGSSDRRIIRGTLLAHAAAGNNTGNAAVARRVVTGGALLPTRRWNGGLQADAAIPTRGVGRFRPKDDLSSRPGWTGPPKPKAAYRDSCSRRESHQPGVLRRPVTRIGNPGVATDPPSRGKSRSSICCPVCPPRYWGGRYWLENCLIAFGGRGVFSRDGHTQTAIGSRIKHPSARTNFRSSPACLARVRPPAGGCCLPNRPGAVRGKP